MNVRRLVVCVLLAGGCGLTRVPSPPTAGTIPATDGGASGYQHGFEGSLQVLGSGPRSVFQYGYVKRIGDQGTIAIRMSNGSAFGLANANTPSLQAGPYGKKPEEHDQFVKEYFIRSGIPADQIARMRTMTQLDASGPISEGRKAKPSVAAYYSVLERGVDGIDVPDSFAWARVTADGKVVAEGVYWPAISGSVVTAARRFREQMSDKQRLAAFAARVRASNEGHVVIRHSSAFVDSPFESFASFDVTVVAQATSGTAVGASNEAARTETTPASSRQSVIHHYDESGTERLLPQEKRSVASEGQARAHKHS